MSGNIYFSLPAEGSTNLRSCAQIVFHDLKISVFSRRESSNYLGGEYFQGQSAGLNIELALADDPAFDEYQFWLSISPEGVWIKDKCFLNGLADLMARYLTLKSYKVASDPSGGRVGSVRLIYSLKGGGSLNDQVEVKEA